MKRMKKTFVAAALAGTALALAGCYGTSTYTIATNPRGANVYLDDEYVGTSPVELKSSLGCWRVFNSPDVRIEMPGYETVEYTKNVREAKPGYGALYSIGTGALCGLPLFLPVGNDDFQGGGFFKYDSDAVQLVPERGV